MHPQQIKAMRERVREQYASLGCEHSLVDHITVLADIVRAMIKAAPEQHAFDKETVRQLELSKPQRDFADSILDD
jgi:hypothetical protein